MTNAHDTVKAALENAMECSPNIGKYRYREALAILETHAIVPLEPTDKMLRALMDEWDSTGGKTMADNYKAMIKAAGHTEFIGR